MDFSKFVTCLSDNELNELQELIHSEKVRRFDIKSFPPLTDEERNMLTSLGKVRTILAYRVRTSQNLYVCKMMVDFANENISV